MKECEINGKKYKIIICLAIIALSIIMIYKFMETGNTKKYTYNELKALSAKELYEVFIDNGLKVDEELKTYMPIEEIADMIKIDFDSLILGYPRGSHSMYMRFAQEIKRVYELIVDI